MTGLVFVNKMAAVVDNLSMAAVVVFIIFAAWFHWMVDNVFSEKEAVFRLSDIVNLDIV